MPSALKGVALVSAAVFMFALSDTVGKYLLGRYSVNAVVGMRYVVNVLLLAALLGPSQRANLWRTERTAMVVLRGLCLAMASLTMSHALSLMPLGECVSILYLSPFLVMLLASPLLGEKVVTYMWIGALVGFAGVLLIVRPGAGLNSTGVALMLLNVILGTTYTLMTRILAKTESTSSMLFHTAVAGTIVFAVLFVVSGDVLHPTPVDFGLMVLLGALSTAAHFLFTAAYREAPASLLAPINYMHLVWAGLLGYVVFQHVPDGLSLVGMAAVAGAGMTTALMAHLTKAKA
jgi:drug/metabolite transporter (DMT)-like permease